MPYHWFVGHAERVKVTGRCGNAGEGGDLDGHGVRLDA
jgi:hypothetical protein